MSDERAEPDDLFAGDSPRWREVPDGSETEKDRRAHDREPDAEPEEGAIERD